MRKLLLFVVIAATLGLAGSARAATIATPASGTTVTQGQAVYFDWAWAEDEYDTSEIVFTRSADPNDPVWHFGPTVPADPNRILIRDCAYGYCSAFLDSHATVTFKGFQTGTWYWRLCNQSIYGEDDKCSYDAEIRSVNVADGPDCNDGFDNDGDGQIDWPYDASDLGGGGCTSADDPDESSGPATQCNNNLDDDGDGDVDLIDSDCTDPSDSSEQAPPAQHSKPKPQPKSKAKSKRLPTLTRSATKHYIRVALKRRFRNSYRHGHAKRISSCKRRSRLRVRCGRVSWAIGDVSFKGWASIWYRRTRRGRPQWNYAYRIKRLNEYCRATGGHHCTKISRVR